MGEDLEAGITTSARNFRWRDRDESADVARSYAELNAYAADFGGWLRVRQVHGSRVVAADQARANGRGISDVDVMDADGIVRETARHGRSPALLTVTVADCVPVFLAWDGGYGLVHAGWRGVAAGVLEAAIAATGTSAADLRVHLGPSIGGCCYEVGPEVVGAVLGDHQVNGDGRETGSARHDTTELQQGERPALRPGRGDRWMMDLKALLAERALASGVSGACITRSPFCTACDPRFHSYRRSGDAEVRRVMLAFIGRRRTP